MGKSAKFLSIFIVAMIVLSIGGFFASYNYDKKTPPKLTTQAIQTTATAVKTTRAQADTTETIITTTESVREKKINKATTKPVLTTKGTADTDYPYNYAGINPGQAKITQDNWNLMLINADNYLPESYNFKLAVAAYTADGHPVKLDERAAVYYKKMFDAAKKDVKNITLSPTSTRGGYRTPATQKGLFENKIARYGTASNAEAVRKAALINQPPGCSEHNAGLAMDIGTTENFEKTKTYQWLSEHAAEYGFIMRYPASKSAITGVMYEPWHWRFVGVEHAPKIKASGLCLEEYLKTL